MKAVYHADQNREIWDSRVRNTIVCYSKIISQLLQSNYSRCHHIVEGFMYFLTRRLLNLYDSTTVVNLTRESEHIPLLSTWRHCYTFVCAENEQTIPLSYQNHISKLVDLNITSPTQHSYKDRIDEKFFQRKLVVKSTINLV